MQYLFEVIAINTLLYNVIVASDQPLVVLFKGQAEVVQTAMENVSIM